LRPGRINGVAMAGTRATQQPAPEARILASYVGCVQISMTNTLNLKPSI
jgi:hypothetical protein